MRNFVTVQYSSFQEFSAFAYLESFRECIIEKNEKIIILEMRVLDSTRFVEVMEEIDFNRVTKLKIFDTNDDEFIDYLRLTWPTLEIWVLPDEFIGVPPGGKVRHWKILK